MKIRTAKRADYENLIKLYNDFVGSDRYSGHDNDSFNAVVDSPDNYVFIAEDEGRLVGFATFTVRLVIRYPKPIAELDELYVSPDYRKLGLGKHLIEKVEEQAKNRNCYRLFIESHYDHKGAHAFYEKLGYLNYGYHFIKNL